MNITYDPKEEAYELPYKIWDEDVTVRFYVDEQQEIFDNLSAIAEMLGKVDSNKYKIADVLADDKYFSEDETADNLQQHISVDSLYFDIDGDELTLCMTVASSDSYFFDKISIEIGSDGGIEVTGTM